MNPQLLLRDIVRRYGDEGQWYAIREARLEVQESDFIAIIGPSGSGKSTLLNVLGLLDDQWNGTYEVDGVDVRSLTRAQKDGLRATSFGFVFQSSYANPYETAARNAALGLAIQGVPLDEQQTRVHDALAVVGLASKEDSLARVLSGGERQRLAIARAIATQPRIILADEPTGNLDSATAAQVMELFQRLNRAGVTLIIVTHDPAVAGYARRIVEMKDGAIVRTHEQPDAAHSSPQQDSPVPAPARSHTRTRAFESTTQGEKRPPRGRALRTTLERLIRAINNVTSRPLRSGALVAAFAVAIAGLVTAAGVGASASQQIADRLDQAALDEVRIATPPEFTADERNRWTDQLEQLDHVVAVGEVAPIDASRARVSRFPLQDRTPFLGSTVALDRAMFEVYEISVSPQNATERFHSDGRVALVGAQIAESLGIAQGAFGAEISVAGRPYTVVGVITDSERAPNLTTSVVLPLDQVDDPAVQLLVRTEVGYSAAVAEAAPTALSPAAPAEVAVSTTGDLRNLRIGVSGDLNGLLNSISVALLVLAVLSASSAMFLAVQSRLQELALSRALGLSRFGVGSVFIWEGITVGFAGALAGLATGLVASVVIAAAQGWTAVVPWPTLVTSPVIGIIAGGLSAFLPALRASRIDPADAIR